MVDPAPEFPPTKRTTLRRRAERGRYDRATVEAILDEGLVAHVGVDGEAAVTVLPMVYGRIGDALYLHGATANALLRVAGAGQDVCVTVTLLDGLVLARSAFHHSVNYRCVVVFGPARQVTDPEEKREALIAVVDHIARGRAEDCRAPTAEELRATAVLKVTIDEVSAKARTGGPIEDPDDVGLPYWGGVLPLALVARPAVPDGHVGPEIEVPGYLRAYERASGS